MSINCWYHDNAIVVGSTLNNPVPFNCDWGALASSSEYFSFNPFCIQIFNCCSISLPMYDCVAKYCSTNCRAVLDATNAFVFCEPSVKVSFTPPAPPMPSNTPNITEVVPVVLSSCVFKSMSKGGASSPFPSLLGISITNRRGSPAESFCWFSSKGNEVSTSFTPWHSIAFSSFSSSIIFLIIISRLCHLISTSIE